MCPARHHTDGTSGLRRENIDVDGGGNVSMLMMIMMMMTSATPYQGH